MFGQGRYILCRTWAQKKTGVDRFCEAFGYQMPSASKRDGEEKKAASEDGESSSPVDVSASESEDIIPEAKAAVVRRLTPKAVASKALQPTPKGFAAKAPPPAGPPPRHVAMGHVSSGVVGAVPRPKPRLPVSKKAASSSRRERPKSSKGGKSEKGKQGPALQLCGYCGEQVNTQLCNAMAQHQKWNQRCVTWQYHNRGYSWSEAEGKAERKLEHRRQRCYAQARQEVLTEKAERKKEKEKKVALRRTPSPDMPARKGNRHHRRDPDGQDREGRHPKLSRQDGHTFIFKV